MFKRNKGSLDRIANLALATVLLPAGLFWLGGLQGNLGGLFAAGIGGLALLTGLTGGGVLYNPFGSPRSSPGIGHPWNLGLVPEPNTRIARSYKEESL